MSVDSFALRGDGSERLLRIASIASPIVALVLLLVKAWAWSATGSVAVLSSVADSLLDLAAALITFFAIRYALVPPDREHRFGHGKSEALAALVQVLLIAGSAAFVASEAVGRLLAPSPVQAPQIGIAVMVFSILLTLALLALQRFAIARTGSLALRADAAHYRSDLLTNGAVAAGLLVSLLPGWGWADPVIGLAIALFIVHSAYGLLRPALNVLLDRELPDDFRKRLIALARAHERVLGVHDVRTRHSGTQRFVQLHLELDPAMPLAAAHEIADAVEARIREALGPMEILIHLDPAGIETPHDHRG